MELILITTNLISDSFNMIKVQLLKPK